MKTPPKLYRYRPLEDALLNRELGALRDSYLYSPPFAAMNDPMEAFYETGGPSDRIINAMLAPTGKRINGMYEMLSKMINRFALVSFAGTHEDLPMWAYYGSNFAGMCLEFDAAELAIGDFQNEKLRPVTYLLISLSQIGREYWLPVSVLLRHFLIQEEEGTGKYIRATGFMNHFSLTILLSYIKDKSRYTKLKAFIEAEILAKLQDMKVHCPDDAETLIMLLDLIVCPYISNPTKAAIGAIFGLNVADLATVQATNDHWFTAWGEKFDLGKELDAKRSREVY